MPTLYPTAAQKLWEAQFNWTVDTFKVALLSSTYVYNSSHEFYTSLSGVVGTPQTITGKTNVLGVLDALDTLFAALTGSQVTQAVVYKDTGVAATSPLLFHLNSGNNLPITPDGTDLNWKWSEEVAKIARTQSA